jgi:hypothetical protein
MASPVRRAGSGRLAHRVGIRTMGWCFVLDLLRLASRVVCMPRSPLRVSECGGKNSKRGNDEREIRDGLDGMTPSIFSIATVRPMPLFRFDVDQAAEPDD